MANYIDRDKLLEITKPKGISDDIWVNSSLYKTISDLPTEDVVPIVHAHWIFVGTKIAKCSN